MGASVTWWFGATRIRLIAASWIALILVVDQQGLACLQACCHVPLLAQLHSLVGVVYAMQGQSTWRCSCQGGKKICFHWKGHKRNIASQKKLSWCVKHCNCHTWACTDYGMMQDIVSVIQCLRWGNIGSSLA